MTDYERKAAAEHQARIDSATAERDRTERILREDETRYRAAVHELVARVALFAQRPALFDDAELAELDSIAALLTAAQGRGSIMKARRKYGTGLIGGITGRTPTYDPSRVVPGNSGADWTPPAQEQCTKCERTVPASEIVRGRCGGCDW